MALLLVWMASSSGPRPFRQMRCYRMLILSPLFCFSPAMMDEHHANKAFAQARCELQSMVLCRKFRAMMMSPAHLLRSLEGRLSDSGTSLWSCTAASQNARRGCRVTCKFTGEPYAACSGCTDWELKHSKTPRGHQDRPCAISIPANALGCSHDGPSDDKCDE
ncbi:hypothetical protein BU26DRAFT_1521 [Trematosphaeria pertusa]|uniref:Uncharacterized protein n=1 Tax=Trematosphaeria pertusa TaxID=390896 RepID=A0A6A6J0Y6_9PLEO|nr:uncharacterized protein BU26DRAFT_1521 [Trematosphaeria pertusa]KAF2255530.1 hypothetical protein BU26DRAFT_1521 [Trematosphaeria pertusa]